MAWANLRRARARAQAIKLTAYGWAAAWLSGIFSLQPMLSVLGLFAAFYSLYLTYTGLAVLMKSSPARSLGYLISVLAEQASHVPRSDSNRSTDESVSRASRAASSTTEVVGSIFSALGNAANDGKPVEAADYRRLKALLPESIPGMQSGEATGARETLMGIDRSLAKATYVGPQDSRIVIEAFDVGGSLGRLGLAAFSWAGASAVMDKETAYGYEKTTTYRGGRAFEQYNRADRSGELSVLVNGTSAATGRGRQVTAEALREALDRVNLNGVSAAGTS